LSASSWGRRIEGGEHLVGLQDNLPHIVAKLERIR
jgi:hypothetical protein